MTTTSDYLTQLQTDKQTLVSKLIEKGVEASNNETFTELASKVGDIQSGENISEYLRDNTNGSSAVSYFGQFAFLVKKVVLNSINPLATSTRYYFQGGRVEEVIINNWEENNINNINSMFNTSSLIYINIGSFNMSKITSCFDCFSGTNHLETLIFGFNYGFNENTPSLNLSQSYSLTHDSLMDVINKLYDLNITYDVANGGELQTKGLILGSTNLAKLTAEEIAIATAKGWTVS